MEIFKLLDFVFFIQGLDAYRTKGTIISPGYPGKYPKNCNNTWLIEAPPNASRISIIIQDQSIHGTKGFKCDDFLKIEEYESKFTLYKQCGEGSIHNILANGRRVLVSFKSDDFGTARGFKLQWSVASYKHVVFTTKKTMPSILPKRLTTATQTLSTSITGITQKTSPSTISSTTRLMKTSPTVAQTTKIPPFLTTARKKAIVKDKFSNSKTRKMVIFKNSTPSPANRLRPTNGPSISEYNTFPTKKDSAVISTEPTVNSSTTTVYNFNQTYGHNLSEVNTNPLTILTTKSPFIPILWEENTLHVSTKLMKVSSQTKNTRTEQKSNLVTLTVRGTFQTYKYPPDQTQSEDISMSSDKKTTIQSSTAELEVKKEVSSSHLNSFIPVLLCVSGFLFFLLFIFLFIVFVQRRKIKRLQEDPSLTYLHNNRRYSTILQTEHRPIEGIHIYDHADRILPNRKENDYKYLSPESCPKHKKSQKIRKLQDRASKHYFCPAEMAEIKEQSNYIEILPDAGTVYYEPASSFESAAIYAQSTKRRPYSTINEVHQSLDVSKYESLNFPKTSFESYQDSGKG